MPQLPPIRRASAAADPAAVTSAPNGARRTARPVTARPAGRPPIRVRGRIRHRPAAARVAPPRPPRIGRGPPPAGSVPRPARVRRLPRRHGPRAHRRHRRQRRRRHHDLQRHRRQDRLRRCCGCSRSRSSSWRSSRRWPPGSGSSPGRACRDLIRDRFGVRWTVFAMLILLDREPGQHGRRVRRRRRRRSRSSGSPATSSSRSSRSLIWALVLFASYRTVERVFLVGGARVRRLHRVGHPRPPGLERGRPGARHAAVDRLAGASCC